MKRLILLVVSTLAAISSAIRLDEPKQYFEAERDVQMDLYTLKNPTRPQTLVIYNTSSIHESNFNPNVATRIFIHGFQSKGELKNTLTQAYFERGNKDVNLIAVNWEQASGTFNYPAAAGYVKEVGAHTAQFVDFMVDNKFLQLSDLIVIGFSLGAHGAGFTGKRLRSGKLPKIIGLDPASPNFYLHEPNGRLDRNDAVYVETIHTNGGKLGFFEPLGTVSFYANGGRTQPACNWDVTGKCSHQTAYKYFAESINAKHPLQGYYCHSLHDVKVGNCSEANGKSVMGGEPGAHQQQPGIYYLTIATNSMYGSHYG